MRHHSHEELPTRLVVGFLVGMVLMIGVGGAWGQEKTLCTTRECGPPPAHIELTETNGCCVINKRILECMKKALAAIDPPDHRVHLLGHSTREGFTQAEEEEVAKNFLYQSRLARRFQLNKEAAIQCLKELTQ